MIDTIYICLHPNLYQHLEKYLLSGLTRTRDTPVIFRALARGPLAPLAESGYTETTKSVVQATHQEDAS